MKLARKIRFKLYFWIVPEPRTNEELTQYLSMRMLYEIERKA